MSAKNKDTKKYRSRYDENRHCYRKDETTYVYMQWVEDENGKNHYVNYEFHVGEDGITIELLDMLQEADNEEAQNSEDAERNEDQFVHAESSEYDADNFNYSPYDNISTSHVNSDGVTNLAAPYTGSPEYIGPEAVLFVEEKSENPMAVMLEEQVRPKLSEDQQNLIYDYYGMCKTVEQIAAESPAKADGSHVSHQAVSNRLKKIKAKTEKNMLQ